MPAVSQGAPNHKLAAGFFHPEKTIHAILLRQDPSSTGVNGLRLATFTEIVTDALKRHGVHDAEAVAADVAALIVDRYRGTRVTVNDERPAQQRAERDRRICRYYLEQNVGTAVLATRFGLTSTRILQIVRKHQEESASAAGFSNQE